MNLNDINRNVVKCLWKQNAMVIFLISLPEKRRAYGLPSGVWWSDKHSQDWGMSSINCCGIFVRPLRNTAWNGLKYLDKCIKKFIHMIQLFYMRWQSVGRIIFESDPQWVCLSMWNVISKSNFERNTLMHSDDIRRNVGKCIWEQNAIVIFMILLLVKRGAYGLPSGVWWSDKQSQDWSMPSINDW